MSTPSPEAIEAAARAIYRSVNRGHADTKGWDEVKPNWQHSYRANARAALSAAAPLIEAHAKAEALRESVAEFEGWVGVGEFDEQNRRNGRRHTHSDEAWEHQGPYMGWLLNRADQIEGKN